MSAERRQRLESLAGWVWVWDALEASWEEGFSHLTAYVQAEGHARVSQRHRTADGYPLGRWVGHQRSRKDSMSAERRQRLESLAGWGWDLLAADWEEGFGHLVAYVADEGHARVPQSHRTADGYRLGQWVGNQRSTKDTLSADRRERLDAVKGWVWNARP